MRPGSSSRRPSPTAGLLALADALVDGFAMTLIAAVVGSAAYVVLLRLVAARQVTVVAQALRPSEA